MNYKKTFKEQQTLINYFFDNLDHQQVNKFIDLILECQGISFLTGVGKSGIIARNISQMLVSTGHRAMFLDPVNALHGDVGVVGSNDLVVLFSRSGQTTELVNLIPALRNKEAKLVAVVSNENSLLSKVCQETILLPLQKELCPFDLAPVTSSAIQLIFGNTVVACLMNKTGLTKEDYALNHPAGRIGKRLTVRVEDIMKPVSELAICFENDLLINKIGEMSSKRSGNLLILGTDKKIVGIFTDGDLRRTIQNFGPDGLQKTLKEIMTHNPLTITKDVMAFKAMEKMETVGGDKKRVKELAVVDKDKKLIGLITLHDLVKSGL